MTFPVPDLETGIAFYVDRLGHVVRWRNDDIGQAGLGLPDSDTEIVLTTGHDYEPNWLVESADDAARAIEAAGGVVLTAPFDIPVGRVAVWPSGTGMRVAVINRSGHHRPASRGRSFN